MLWPAGLLQQFGMGLLKEKGLEELADDTQGTAPVSSSRGLCMSESLVVVGRQAGGSQAGIPLQALAHAAGEAQLTNQCLVKLESRPVWIQSSIALHYRRGLQGNSRICTDVWLHHSSMHRHIADMWGYVEQAKNHSQFEPLVNCDFKRGHHRLAPPALTYVNLPRASTRTN